MEIVYKKVNELIPYKSNPRINDEAVEYVKNSIKEFGFKVPIVIDKNNVIIAGHTRLKASLELGLKEVPCIIADDLSEEQIKAFRLADNKVSEKFYYWVTTFKYDSRGNKIYSNINESEELKTNDDNIFGILVPTTINVNTTVDNKKYVKEKSKIKMFL